jgi:hypothetical protein
MNRGELGKPLNSIIPLYSDSNTDRLIDDLLIDLNRILNANKPSSTLPFAAYTTTIVPASTLTTEYLEPNLSTWQYSSTNLEKGDKIRTNKNNYLDKILFALSFGYLTATMFWLIAKDKLPLTFNLSASPVNLSTSQPDASSDSQFIQQIQDSLAQIEKRNAGTVANATTIPAEKIVYVPVYATNGQQIALSSNAPQLTNIPVPISTITTTSTQPPTSQIPLSPTTTANKPLKTIPIPLKIQQPLKEIITPPAPPSTSEPKQLQLNKTESQPTQKIPVPPPPTRKSILPVIPTTITTSIPPENKTVPVSVVTPTVPETVAPPSVTTVATNSNVVKTTPLVGYTLMGILNLGERSAVLFKVDGNHQRVWIGETVGNTGWILNSIEEQQAVLKRNGESKTLKIGDIF